jgi:hypothetical protein
VILAGIRCPLIFDGHRRAEEWHGRGVDSGGEPMKYSGFTERCGNRGKPTREYTRRDDHDNDMNVYFSFLPITSFPYRRAAEHTYGIDNNLFYNTAGKTQNYNLLPYDLRTSERVSFFLNSNTTV